MNSQYLKPEAAAGPTWAKSSYSGTNNNCVEVAQLPSGGRAVRDSKNAAGPTLVFTAGEWSAFVRGIPGTGGSSELGAG